MSPIHKLRNFLAFVFILTLLSSCGLPQPQLAGSTYVSTDKGKEIHKITFHADHTYTYTIWIMQENRMADYKGKWNSHQYSEFTFEITEPFTAHGWKVIEVKRSRLSSDFNHRAIEYFEGFHGRLFIKPFK